MINIALIKSIIYSFRPFLLKNKKVLKLKFSKKDFSTSSLLTPLKKLIFKSFCCLWILKINKKVYIRKIIINIRVIVCLN
jgi:hypothetical protein